MATALLVQQPRSADPPSGSVEGFPRIEPCPKCGEATLLARHGRAGVQGRPFRLELPEIFPRGECGRCRGRGCGWCANTGERGEDIPNDAVIFNLETGHARRNDGWRDRWDAFYRRHRCGEHGPADPEGDVEPDVRRRQALYLGRAALQK